MGEKRKLTNIEVRVGDPLKNIDEPQDEPFPFFIVSFSFYPYNYSVGLGYI